MSLDKTSLTHSLLLGTTHSIVMVSGMWALKLARIRPDLAISWGESLGTVVGFAGLAIVSLDISADAEVTLLGDVYAFLGGVAMIVYLVVGFAVRQQLPLFVYVFPVTALAAVVLSLAAAVAEYDTVSSAGGWGLFAWTWTSPDVWYVIYVGVVPGIMGHTFINWVLRHLPSLVVSVTLMTEPLVGTLIGLVVGESSVPGLWTFVGGPILLAGSVWTTMSSHRRQRKVKGKIVAAPLEAGSASEP